MIALPRDQALKFWKTYWNNTEREFFKVEAVQDYSAEEIVQSPAYAAWNSGDKDKSIAMMRQNAQQYSEQTRSKQFRKLRYRIVEEPYTSYLEWEIMHYALVNIPVGGEEVFLVQAQAIRDLTIPGDFMIFDDSFVANSMYDATGRMTGMDFYDTSDDISEFLRLKAALISKGTVLGFRS